MIKTIWLREFYDPSKPPPPSPPKPLERDAQLVYEGIQAGKLTCKSIAMHYGMNRGEAVRGMKELESRGIVSSIGQGGAKRYLLNQDWRQAA